MKITAPKTAVFAIGFAAAGLEFGYPVKFMVGAQI